MHHTFHPLIIQIPKHMPARIYREVWHRIAYPGTLRGLLRASVQWVCGRGWAFQWPAATRVASGRLLRAASTASTDSDLGECSKPSSSEW
jgi:hypothetical protein